MTRIWLKLACVALLAWSPLAATAQQYNAPTANSAGEIQDLDFANNLMLVSGYRYHVSPTAHVEIDGTFGAFTMLKPGMLVEIEYLSFDDGVRRITRLVQVAAIEET